MMILTVAIQIIPELLNSVSFTVLQKNSIRREEKKKSHYKELKTIRFNPKFFV